MCLKKLTNCPVLFLIQTRSSGGKFKDSIVQHEMVMFRNVYILIQRGKFLYADWLTINKGILH